ncbi:MAG: hypothetical protein HN741_09965, partial [Anaerolineae bacterium]|nr:hypothetical protein [Anaerolineae bacterium]
LSASAGVATQGKEIGPMALLDDFIQGADEALYKAKKMGGNSVQTTLL